jgi:gluconate 2-dehydrogenase gamma chain
MQLQDYCQAAKGGKFQSLSYETQIATLQELYDNSPTNTALQSAFVSPTASDFYNEVYDLVVAGFWADPLYGGNSGKVGWNLIASNGVNSGSAQGHSPLELALSTTTVKLPPMGLGDLQRGAPM